MKSFLRNLTKKQIGLTLLGLGFIMICLGIHIIATVYTNSLNEQQMAERWSEDGGVAQISCFFAQNAKVTTDQLTNFEHQLDAALKEASIESVNENARLWASAYSAMGEITATSEKTSLTANAIGVSGDFFQFHPLKLVSGRFFSGSDLMTDYVVIDEDAAWQLFGSNDVDGMKIEIKGVPHTVVGVIERDESKVSKAAGLNETTIYVSYDTLNKYGTNHGISSYEIVMPNPITGFALGLVKSKIGIAEDSLLVVENSNRFSFLALLGVFKNFGIRSMSVQDIVFPYWENVARYYEDVLAILLVLQIIFILIPIVLLTVFIVKLYKNRSWHWRDVLNLIKWIGSEVAIFIKNNKNKMRKSEYEESDEMKTLMKLKKGDTLISKLFKAADRSKNEKN